MPRTYKLTYKQREMPWLRFQVPMMNELDRTRQLLEYERMNLYVIFRNLSDHPDSNVTIGLSIRT